MNFSNNISGSAPGLKDNSFEDTLRLVASLPAPEGLEDRVQAALKSAPHTARVLAWPTAPRRDSGWMRAVAAAAIVFVVAGGGWGIYSRVQPAQPGRVIAMPHAVAPGGFSNAGAMRTPQTLNGPVVAHPVEAQTPHVKPVTKATAKTPIAKQHRGKSAAAQKAAVQPVAGPAK